MSLPYPGTWHCFFLLLPIPGDLPDSGIEPRSPSLADGFFTTEPPGRLIYVSVQFNSVSQLCPTLCDHMDCSTPGFPVYHQLPELTQTHVHCSVSLIFYVDFLVSISFISALIFVVSFLLSTLSLQVKVAQMCLTLCDPMDCSPWNCSGQNIGMGSFSFLQGIFPTQGSNPGFLHCRRILYQLSHKGSPRILEWVGYPFSSGSSWPMNETGVSCIAGGFFTNWAIREAHRLFCF